MSDQPSVRDLERQLARSLQAAAPVPAADLADRLLARTAGTPQHKRWWGGLRMAPALAAAAVVAVAVVVGLQLGTLLDRDVGPPVGTAAPTAPARTGTPEPTPSTPAPSPEVFPGGGTCTNPELGYTVAYPADWFANEAVAPDDEVLDPVPACGYFGREPIEVLPNAGLPPTVVVSFSRLTDVPPPSTGATVISTEQVTVAGRPATVREDEEGVDSAFSTAGDRHYSYFVELADGDVLVVSTGSRGADDYEANKGIVDDMLRTLELSGG